MNLNKLRASVPGTMLCLGLAVAASLLGRAFPIVGAAIFALSGGLVLRAALGAGKAARFLPSLQPGVAFAAKPLLQLSIVLLGAKTSLGRVAAVGAESLVVMLASLSAAFLTAWVVGRALRVEPKLAALVGTGTAICGGSAIAAAAPVLGADESDTAYAFSVIFAFNLAAIFIFPPLGRLFGLSDPGFGLWAGTAINDTSSVVAAAYAWSPTAGDYAVVVKLARTAMIVPVTLALGFLSSKGAFDRRGSRGLAVAEGGPAGARKKVAPLPWFILAFLGASLARSLGLIPAELGSRLADAGVFLIAAALAGIGLSTDFRRIARTGWRPLALGLAVWAAVAASSLGAQFLMGRG